MASTPDEPQMYLPFTEYHGEYHIPVSGSTRQVAVAGVASSVPALSRAFTATVWSPSPSWV